MSRYFVQAEDGIGPGGDIFFRRFPGVPEWYRLYVGDAYLGQVMKGRVGRSWTALSHDSNSGDLMGEVRSLEGFATRWHAAGFIIRRHGYWLRNEREQKRHLEELEAYRKVVTG